MIGADGALVPLLVWLSPAFPVGAFAYSHGLEEAVDAGLVEDRAGLEAWIGDLMRQGSIRQDAVLAAAAWREGRDAAALAEINDLALALASARERRLETAATGRAFADILAAAWPRAAAAPFPAGELAYPVAFGAAAAAEGLPLVPALEAYALAFAANLVSAALRLGPIGQTDGQRVTAALAPEASRLAASAAATPLDGLGSCAFRSDLAALRHEQLYSRLFRS